MSATPHDAPSAAELVEAVREWLERDVLTSTDGRLKFHTRVAVNVLAMVERELSLGDQHGADHAARLTSLGVESDAELAAAIRSESVAVEPDVLRAALLDSVVDKLAGGQPEVPRGLSRSALHGDTDRLVDNRLARGQLAAGSINVGAAVLPNRCVGAEVFERIAERVDPFQRGPLRRVARRRVQRDEIHVRVRLHPTAQCGQLASIARPVIDPVDHRPLEAHAPVLHLQIVVAGANQSR